MPSTTLSSSQQATVESGKPAVLRPLALPPPPSPPGPDASRCVRPDLTGLYESVPPSDKWNSSRLLQLNQCGQALVGWLSRPPPFVQPIIDFPLRQGVLVAFLRDKTALGYQFFYREVTTSLSLVNDEDPSLALSPFNPWPANDPPADLTVGHINFAPNTDGSPLITIRLDTEMLDFAQLSAAPRLSSSMIRSQDPSIRSAYQLYQQQYIPRSFFDTTKDSGLAWKTASDLFTQDSPLATLIRHYVEQSDGDFSLPLVGKIKSFTHAETSVALAQIDALLQFPWDGDRHARLLALLLSREAWHPLTISSHSPPTQSFSDWLAWIAEQEKTYHGIEGAPLGFQKLLAGQELYRYDLAFSETYKQPLSGGALSAAGALFAVTITFYVGRRNFDQKDDDGSCKVIWNLTPSGSVAQYQGAFLEGKAGLGDPPGLPEKVSFVSSHPLHDSDFDKIRFDLIALDAAATTAYQVKLPFLKKLGPKISVGGTSYLLRLHIGDDVLEGMFEKFNIVPQWDLNLKVAPDPKNAPKTAWDIAKSGMHGKAPDLVGLTKKKDILSASIGVTLAEGFIAHESGFADWKSAPPVAKVGHVETDGDTCTPAAFEKDKCEFSREYKGWKVRDLLELELAIKLAVFSGAPLVEIHGFASPEGPTQYNYLLSLSRAGATRQAIEDALGYQLLDELTAIVGHGESTAEATPEDGGGGLHDPETDPQWTAHEEETKRWPEHRKVEFHARRHFVLKVLTVSSSDAG